MSGKGPANPHASQSKHTKPAADVLEHTTQHRDTDDKFKKLEHVVVSKPKTTDHNIMDDYIKNPPRNLPGDPAGDISIGRGEEEKPPAPDTVQAKSPEEIQARIDAAKKHQ